MIICCKEEPRQYGQGEEDLGYRGKPQDRMGKAACVTERDEGAIEGSRPGPGRGHSVAKLSLQSACC